MDPIPHPSNEPFQIPYLNLLGVADSLANSTTKSLNLTSGKIPEVAENVGSLVNSIFFIVTFIPVFIILLVFYYKQKQDMKRNQRFLFVLVAILIVVEVVGLSIRIVYNGTALHMNQSDWQNLPNLLSYRIVLWVSAVLENAIVYSEVITITLIMAFLQDIFLTTAAAAGSMSKKTYRRLRYSLIIFSVLASIVLSIVIIINATLNLLVKMSVIDKNASIPLQVVLLVVYFITSVLTLIVFSIVSIRLINIVKKTSSNISSAVSPTQKKKQRKQVPYMKIVGLMFGMIISSFLQILSAIISFLTSSYAGYLHILDYFCQAAGILTFVVFVLLLYNPLWRREVAEDQQRALDDTQTDTSSQQVGNRKTLKIETQRELQKLDHDYLEQTPVSPTVQSPKAETLTTTTANTATIGESFASPMMNEELQDASPEIMSNINNSASQSMIDV